MEPTRVATSAAERKPTMNDVAIFAVAGTFTSRCCATRCTGSCPSFGTCSAAPRGRDRATGAAAANPSIYRSATRYYEYFFGLFSFDRFRWNRAPIGFPRSHWHLQPSFLLTTATMERVSLLVVRPVRPYRTRFFAFPWQGANWTGVEIDEFLDCEWNLAHNRQTRMLADLSLVGCYNSSLEPAERDR